MDDCPIFAPKKSEADNLIQELEDKFAIEDEGDVSGHLGINITLPTEGAIKMNQPAFECWNENISHFIHHATVACSLLPPSSTD